MTEVADHLSTMLIDLGEVMPDVTAVLKSGDTSWVVGFRDGQSFEIDLDAANGRVYLATTLGTPPPAIAEDIHASLLTYNMLARETGGVRMATAAPGGEVYMMLDVFLPEASEELLARLLTNMSRTASHWRRFVATGTLAEAGAAGEDPSTFIRV